MSELGRLLSEARTAKERSLADVEATTCIRQKYLQALENGNYAALPRGAVGRGLLRIYARYLGLDEIETLRLYGRESGDTSEEFEIAEPGKPRLVDYRPIEVELVDTRPDLGRLRWAIAFLIVAAVVVAGGWLLLNSDLGWNLFAVFSPASAVTPTAPPPSPTVATTSLVLAPTATLPSAPTTNAQPPDETPRPTPTSDLLPLPIPTTEPTVTPTPRPTATPEIVSRIALTMQITQLTWVEVTVDGIKVVFGELMEAGQRRAWEARRSITVRTGNAAGVVLTLNGTELGAMGKINEVVERTWVAEGNQITETGATPTPTPKPTATPTPAG
jgi:cytoskeletal protein RodZ